MKNNYRRHQFTPSIIQYAVWPYYRFNLSVRDVEDLLTERNVSVSPEAVQLWMNKFGPQFAGWLNDDSRGLGITTFWMGCSSKPRANNTLQPHWVLVIMDQTSRRNIGFDIHKDEFDGITVCRMFNTENRPNPICWRQHNIANIPELRLSRRRKVERLKIENVKGGIRFAPKSTRVSAALERIWISVNRDRFIRVFLHR